MDDDTLLRRCEELAKRGRKSAPTEEQEEEIRDESGKVVSWKTDLF